MISDELILEYEDDEAPEAKKPEASPVTAKIEVKSEPVIPKPIAVATPTPAPAPAAAAPAPVSAPKLEAVVRPIQSARPIASIQPQQPQNIGSAALKMEPLSHGEAQELIDLRERMRQVEINAEVKVQVAEFKTDFLTEMLSDMKLMEHQVGQLLVRINAKHPDLKNEALMIKKILADYTTKKRK